MVIRDSRRNWQADEEAKRVAYLTAMRTTPRHCLGCQAWAQWYQNPKRFDGDKPTTSHVCSRGFMEKHLDITNKQGKVQKLEYNDSQDLVWEVLYVLDKEGKPLRIIVLKSRQVGISTAMSGLVFARTYCRPNTDSMIIGHHKKATTKLFQKQQYFYEHLEPELRYPLERSNTEELYCKLMNWRITLATAGTSAATRSNTLTNVLFTEVGYYDDLFTIKGATEAGVPMFGDSLIAIESTANGMGSEYHVLWEMAEAGEIEYYPLFLEWFKDRQCQLPKFANAREADSFLEPMFEKCPELRERQQQFKLTPEQVGFYGIMAKKYNWDLVYLGQEFPCTPQEAWLASGRTVVPTRVILQHVNLNKDVPSQKYDPHLVLIQKQEKTRWIEAPWLIPKQHDYLEIWHWPIPQRHYLVVVDTAQGTEKGDYSCAKVFDIATQRLVATLHGKMEPKTLGKDMAPQLARLYNNAILVIEVDGLGYTTLSYAKDVYGHHYQQRKDDGFATQVTHKLGWETNTETRANIVANMRHVLGEHAKDAGFCPDKQLLDELLKFVEINGKPQAQKGFHDDHVMTYAIGLWTCLEEIKIRPEILWVLNKVDTVGDSVVTMKPSDVVRKVRDPRWHGCYGQTLSSVGTAIDGPFCPEEEFEW